MRATQTDLSLDGGSYFRGVGRVARPVTALLQIVYDAREMRDAAEREFQLAIARAKERHSYRDVAAAAGMTRAGVQHVLRRHREETK